MIDISDIRSNITLNQDYIDILSLVGGLEHEFDFPHQIGDVIIHSDELICFRWVGLPSTSINQKWYIEVSSMAESTTTSTTEKNGASVRCRIQKRRKFQWLRINDGLW